MEHSWFKNAVFYSLDVETFKDADDDGIGDFQGLISKVDYIAGLGATCIWLLPFYPSPNRDNGYDVMDYYNVDHRLGTLGDFSEFIRTTRNAGIRVIIDLVVNHTSHEHAWFQEARRDKNSRYRDFYIWSDKPLPYDEKKLHFRGEEETIWTYDEEAGQYYLHRFYREQPDLNLSCPELRTEILKIMGFWLSLGVSGFRVDAAEIMIETYGMRGVTKEELESFFDEMRAFCQERNHEAILLAETNVTPEKTHVYIRNGKRMHMLFNFYLNQHLFLSLARKDSAPIIESLQALPKLDHHHQWLNFLRHHDELSLKLLSESEKQEVLTQFAPAKDMRIFGSGIRRRLAPMLDGNRDRLELCYSLLFSLPGVPLLRYGDEIAMGDDLSLEGRNSVRTPMQWSDAIHGAFSGAAKNELVHPVIENGRFGYQDINVIEEQRHPSSLLNWIERLITIRKQCPEIGVEAFEIIRARESALLIHAYHADDESLIFIHNLSDQPVFLGEKSWPVEHRELKEIFCSDGLQLEAQELEVKPYAYLWLRKNKK
jgi:maltose alpha-D-glucosyltransferase / alpha-amylase